MTCRTDYPGLKALKLTAEHFPLPCSLKARVTQHFADSSGPADAGLAMDAQEVIGYLRNMDYEAFYPMAGILAQTEAIGDPALPSNEQGAILRWLDVAMKNWDQHFPLEQPMAIEVRRLRPLVAAQAIMDISFLTPGTHPLHQLLDAIHMYAVGWQTQLGRMGRVLEDEIRDVVAESLVWFDTPSTDLSVISTRLTASVAKAAARAQKMEQRLIAAEHGRIRLAKSKQQAALMINAALEKHLAPQDIATFIKGPWYDSAQLLLTKFGETSAEWTHMSLTTTHLLQSLQNPEANMDAAADGRQRIFELVAELPKELVKCLLSLQHDGEAVAEALGHLQVLHSALLRGDSLQLERVAPIPVSNSPKGSLGLDKSLNLLEEGQWLILKKSGSPPLRAMLVLRLDEEQQLLFANRAGIKVLSQSFSEFSQLMLEGRVTLLDTGASFSRCLALSAGVETQDDLDELTGVAAERARLKEQEREKAERERLRLERKREEREQLELERQRQEQEEIDQLQREIEEAERLQRDYEHAEKIKQKQAEQERLQLAGEREEAKRLQTKWETVSLQFFQRLEAERQLLKADQTTEAGEQGGGAGLNIARCAWLGFHDGEGEEVVMARLALHNRDEDDYTFVDRHGMKVRQLSGKELLIIMTRGLVDILEARSRFKKEVAQAQKVDSARVE